MVCLLLRHLTLSTNSLGGCIFLSEVTNKYISVFIYEPQFILKPVFLYSVDAAAGYDTCQFNEGLHAIHHDV